MAKALGVLYVIAATLLLAAPVSGEEAKKEGTEAAPKKEAVAKTEDASKTEAAPKAEPASKKEYVPETPKAPAPPPPPPRFADWPHVCPPMVWGCDNEWKLQFGGAIAFRNEYRKNFDLTHAVKDDDHLSFMRTFLNADLTYRQIARVFVEVMDAQVFNENTDVMQTDHWDISQLFLELKCTPEDPWTLRLGRQRLPVVSEGRLWGLPPVEYYWYNFVPHFDGAMLDYKTADAEVHWFVLQPLSPATIHDGVMSTDRMREVDNTLHYGVYSQFKTWAPHTADFYFLGLSDMKDDREWPKPNLSEEKRNGTTDRYTIGTCWRGPLQKDECGTLGYGLEAAYQFGHFSNNEIKAGMVHADINYQWEKHPWKPKLTFLGNWATGDRKGGDDENNTFSPLFGSSHYPYGTMDFFRLSNLRQLGVTYQWEPCEKVKFVSEYHHFWLDSRTDAWASPLGIVYGKDATGDSGREAGDEIDLTMTYKHSKTWQSEIGVAHFFAGNWAKKQGREDDANFLFVQTVYKF
jgi:hypothetical protein